MGGRHLHLLVAAAAFALFCCFTAIFIHDPGDVNLAWSPPSFQHILGRDEYGRDLLSVTMLSIAWSSTYGLICASLALISASGLAFIIAYSRATGSALFLDSISRVIDGVPVVLWVLVMSLLAPAAPRMVAAFALLLTVLPYLTRLTWGEFRRLATQPFVESARAQELPAWKIALVHLLPNAASVLAPAFAQICGLSVAIDGALALIGTANRSELNIGVMLLRAKEQLGHPILMVTALTSTLVIYAFIAGLIGRFSTERRLPLT